MRLAQAFLLAAAMSVGVSAQTYVLNEKTAIEFALDNDLVIAAESLDPLISYHQLARQKSVYDPALVLRYSLIGDELENVDKRDNASIGLSGETYYGTSYGISLGGTRFRSGLFNASNAVGSELGISLTQPLLRDFGGVRNRAALKIARNDYKASRLDYTQLVMNLVATSLLSYYDLYQAGQNVDVAKRSRDLAEKLLKDNNIRVNAGTMAQTDLFVAESELRSREDVLVAAQSSYDALISQTKTLYSDKRGADLESVRLKIEQPEEPELITVDVETDLATSFEDRPDFRRIALAVESAELALKSSRSGSRPDLSLELDYAVRGTGSSYSSGVSDLDAGKDEAYNVGVALTYPIRNRDLKSVERIAAIQLEQARVYLARAEQSLRLNVRNAAAQLEYSWRRVEISRRALVLAGKSLKAEEKKLEVGTSTTITVLQLQTDLATAEARAIQAVADYEKSIVTYQNLAGKLLRIHNIDIDALAEEVQEP